MIDILLATYNGSRFLEPQIHSILDQDFEGDFRIIARDDGSTDGTDKILNDYQQRFPDRFCLIEDNLGNLGPIKNFEILINKSSAPYIFFADQDDIWHRNKLKKFIEKLLSYEKKVGRNVPILVHCDMEVINDAGAIVEKSFFQSDHLHLRANLLVVENFVTGNAMCLNRKALKFFDVFPPTCLMHDWWLALLVYHNKGQIVTLKETLGQYRQHNSNVVGANYLRNESIFKKIIKFRGNMNLVQQQANYFGKYTYFQLLTFKAFVIFLKKLKPL